MGFFSDLFGGGGNVPTYDINQAKELYNYTLNKGRYNVDNGLAGLQWDPATNTLKTTYGSQLQGVLGNLFGGTNADKQAADSVYSAFSDRYEPIFERQSNNLQDRLVNQGIPVGSEAYSRAMSDMAQTQNDARQQAMYQAQQAGQQARTQEIQNNLGIFSAFNPLSGYTGSSAQGSTAMYDNLYNSQVNAYNAQQQAAQNMAQGWLNLGSAGLNLGLGLFSDARIKENLRPVGQLFNGLTVYAFNFPGEEVTRIGLVAQEVQQAIPQAVSQSEEGLLMVDYDLASRYEGTETEEEDDGNI
nr:MAG TPA: Neck appendage protein [Caudoviricetes sp.]